jgi:hypothetical protein
MYTYIHFLEVELFSGKKSSKKYLQFLKNEFFFFILFTRKKIEKIFYKFKLIISKYAIKIKNFPLKVVH